MQGIGAASMAGLSQPPRQPKATPDVAERRRLAAVAQAKKEAEKDTYRKILAGRLERDRMILAAFEALFVPQVSLEDLHFHSRLLNQQDYKDVVKERTLQGRCGYPLCAESITAGDHDSAKFRISASQRRVFSTKGRKFFCSSECHVASTLFSSTLGEYRRLPDPPSRAAPPQEPLDILGEGGGAGGVVEVFDGPIVEKPLDAPSTKFEAEGYKSVEGYRDGAGRPHRLSRRGRQDGEKPVEEGAVARAAAEGEARHKSGRAGQGSEGGEGGVRKAKGKKKTNQWQNFVMGGEGEGGDEQAEGENDDDDDDDDVGSIELPSSVNLQMLLHRISSPLSKFELRLQATPLLFGGSGKAPSFVVNWEATPRPQPPRAPVTREPLRGTQGVHSAGGGREKSIVAGRKKALSALLARRLHAARFKATEGNAEWGQLLGSLTNIDQPLWSLVLSLDLDTELPSLSPPQMDAILLLFVALLRNVVPAVHAAVVGPNGGCSACFASLWTSCTGLSGDHFASMQFAFLPDKDVDDWLVVRSEGGTSMEGSGGVEEVTEMVKNVGIGGGAGGDELERVSEMMSKAGIKKVWEECGGDASAYEQLEELD